MASDYINREITAQLKPVLAADGFYRKSPKLFVRIRDDLVDVVSFQVSQYGSKLFYVHYFCNLLPDPDWESVIMSYQVGSRIGSRDGDGTKWVGDTEEHATEAMASVVGSYEDTIRPWFQSIPDVRNWIVEYVGTARSSVVCDVMAIALALVGKKNRAWWVLCDLIDAAEEPDRKAMLTEFQEAIDEGRHIAFLEDWKQRAIAMNKLEKAQTT